MPRVAVEDHAVRDPRIGALATATPLRRAEVALCRLLELWSHVTKTQRPVQPQRVVGYSLGLKRPEHVRVLIEVELATEAGEGLLDLSPLGDLFGDWEWYGEERARAGGLARAAEAERGRGGTFGAKLDWDHEILQALAVGERHVADLAQAFDVQRRTVREHLRRMGAAGAVVEIRPGIWQCAGPAPSPAPVEALEPAPAVALDQRKPSATSAPAPSPALSLPPPREGDSAREQTERRDAAWRLAQRHDQVGQRVAAKHGKGWRSQGTTGPQEWARVLLAGATEDECQHVLDVLAAEADERADLGLADPLRFLRTPTSTEIWRRAVGVPDEASAREAARASPDARGARSGASATKPEEPKRTLKRVG